MSELQQPVIDVAEFASDSTNMSPAKRQKLVRVEPATRQTCLMNGPLALFSPVRKCQRAYGMRTGRTNVPAKCLSSQLHMTRIPDPRSARGQMRMPLFNHCHHRGTIPAS